MNRKTIVAIMLLIVFCLSLCGCGEDAAETEESTVEFSGETVGNIVAVPEKNEAPAEKEEAAVNEEEPSEPQESAAPSSETYNPFANVLVWIPTRGGQKYHADAECSDMTEPKQCTIAEAEELGFTPCKKCYK